MAKVIMNHSYKGGCGKTLISINLANILSHSYSVLLIESDLQGPLYHNVFTDNSPDVFFNTYLENPGSGLKNYIYQTKHGFDVIYASPKVESSDLIIGNEHDKLFYNMRTISQQFTDSEYDYIILDESPGITFLAVAELILADYIFLALRPDLNSIEGTKLLLKQVYSNIIRTNKKSFHLFINQIPNHTGFVEWIQEWEIAFKSQFDFIQTVKEIKFSAETSYNVVKHNIILPEDDPTYIELKIFTDEILVEN